jgi:endonuclease/exonuclease/phosphatase family metal-dependent hydrolase
VTHVRVVTYNIYMGGRKGPALTKAVRTLAPDVLLVNESPKTWFLWKRRCHRLAQAWHMQFVAGGRPAGSNMITVGDRATVESSGSEILRQPRFQPRRGIAWAQLRLGGRAFGVVSCHLSLDRGRRAREVERVIEVAGKLHGPVVIAGDLNESPAGPSWDRLEAAGFVDHGDRSWLTFPADRPDKRIDALLVRGVAKVAHHGDPGLSADAMSSASDHRPVLAALEL